MKINGFLGMLEQGARRISALRRFAHGKTDTSLRGVSVTLRIEVHWPELLSIGADAVWDRLLLEISGQRHNSRPNAQCNPRRSLHYANKHTFWHMCIIRGHLKI